MAGRDMKVPMNQHCVLITGGSGLLALNWACTLRERWRVVLGTHRHSVALVGASSLPLHYDNLERLDREIAEIAPDLIVHTAGLTSVDACEADPLLSVQANAKLARTVAEVASRQRIRLIHISTDHLFAGNRSWYKETDATEPLNEYARSKLRAEDWVRQVCPKALVLRTNFFGWGHAGRQSFSDWIIYNLRAGKRISLFDDVYFTPILADKLAIAAHLLIDRSASGIFHLVGDERVSKYEFGRRLANMFNLPGELIERGKISTSKLIAKRPSDMSLDNTRACDLLGTGLGRLDDYFLALRRQEDEGRREELFHAVTE